MSVIHTDAKMPSLKDKIAAKAAAPAEEAVEAPAKKKRATKKK